MAKTAKNSKKYRKPSNMSLYSSLSYKRRIKLEERARRMAEDKASLPKDPVKRFFAHFQWKRIKKYWFSKDGLRRIGKFFAACILIGIIALGGLFLYFKKDIDAIKLNELKVSNTVNTYLDRNGEVLWEDKGDGDYRQVTDGSNIATYMRQATVAIEDKNFYNHAGIDFWALIRATFSTLSGHGVQGGSTLTQQLIKQVYLSDEAGNRTVTGIPRKIKEAILAIELEKMYNKEQIITMYLNQSPYGGRRNGVESAARTYFGKSAGELNLAESALLAAIPNNPGVLNPYNTYGNEALIERQHKVLDSMVEMGYINEQQAKEAKEVAILDQIQPESNQYADMKAPHFVLATRDYLEEKYGMQTMRSGGFTITTTLDYKAQKIAEEAVATGAELTYVNNSDNIAMASIDVETSQIIAMVGSIDWNKPIYGELNAANSPLEPGSTIKPILDYAGLFMQRSGQNYGPGTILRDENIDSIYCAGYTGGSCMLRNSSGAFYGNLPIRKSLGNSLNIAAVKALYINGIENGLEVAHDLGDKSYCTDGSGGLSIAIGSGCNVRLIEHANAYASLARGGSYKDLTYVLELKNSSGDVIEAWKDNDGNRVIDEQVAYMLSDILSDPTARTITFGSQATSFGFNVPGVWTASKTGTTTTANASVTKDSWMASYSTALATVVWNGNHDGSALSSSSNTVVRRVINDFMQRAHTEVYEPAGKWKSGDKPIKPSGIQTLTVNGITDIWPSWYNSKNNSNSNVSTTTLVFNKYTHNLASECTPEDQRISVDVTKTVDPLTKNEVWNVPEPYNREVKDDCTYQHPTVGSIAISDQEVSFSATLGSMAARWEMAVNGSVVKSGSLSSGVNSTGYKIKGGESIKITISDDAGYSASSEMTTPSPSPDPKPDPES